MEIFSEKIDVECEGEPVRPTSFLWRGERIGIDRILRIWHDWGFPPGSPKRKTFRLRRHRTYFQVRDRGGRVFEIYLDRKGPELEWILYRKLDTGEIKTS